MVNALQGAEAKSFREQIGIDIVVLVDQFLLPPDVAHDHPLGDRLQQIVQPLRLRPLFERNVHSRSLPAHQSDDGLGLRRHRRLQNDGS